MTSTTYSGVEHVLPNPFSKVEKFSAVSDPFNDSKAASRVTASGFTESTVNPMFNGNTNFSTISMMEELLKLKDKIEFMESNSPKEDELNRARKALNSKVLENDNEIQKSKRYNSRYESSDDDETIRPNDSASMIQPLELRTKTNHLSERTSVGSTVMSYGCSNFDNVVGGYGISPEDKMLELDSMVKVQKISNLPTIFINERLNFLTHLHKPLYKLLEEDGTYPSENCLGRIRKFMTQNYGKDRDPEEQLLYMAIKSSIDMSRMRVKSNPFNLPVLEVGMKLDDQIIYMTFANLHSEFEIIWFNCMKNAEVPKFHSKFRSSKKRDVVHSRPATASRSNRTSSILSFR